MEFNVGEEIRIMDEYYNSNLINLQQELNGRLTIRRKINCDHRNKCGRKDCDGLGYRFLGDVGLNLGDDPEDCYCGISSVGLPISQVPPTIRLNIQKPKSIKLKNNY